MKKKTILTAVCILFLAESVFAYCNSHSEITGRWAEKLSERVVMDVYANKNEDIYRIFMTWRENNLAQKDIYRFKAKLDDNGVLKYKNGTHIRRSYSDKNKFEDKVNYTDGTGTISINNNELIWTDDKDNTKTEFIRANKDLLKDTTLKSKLFSVTLPEELKGFYEVKTEKDKISVFHKDSKKAGFGGFAFGIKAYKNPSDYAGLPGSRKVGELTDKKGNLYDIVLKHPTDVQYDYTKNSEAPDSFKILYDIGDVINIKGIKGSTYFKNQGTDGVDLYKDILRKHVTAIKEQWDSKKLENENMSYMYKVLAEGVNNPAKLLDKIGYAYYDVNADGIDELLVGEIAEGNWKGVVYDMYTMVNRKPQHAVSGGSRNRYYVCDDAFICNEYSSGALESGVRVYILVENSTELYPQVSFKYDGYTNPKKPWFLSYGSDMNEEKWENVSEKTYRDRKQVFNRYERFNYIPLSKVKF